MPTRRTVGASAAVLGMCAGARRACRFYPSAWGSSEAFAVPTPQRSRRPLIGDLSGPTGDVFPQESSVLPSADLFPRESSVLRSAWSAVRTGAAVTTAVGVALGWANPRRRVCGLYPRSKTLAVADESAQSLTSEALPPIWVVNLDKSVGRWAKCGDEFGKQNIKAERFPATLGKAMTDEELEENVTFGGRYFCTPGMIGCFMSHLRIWQKVESEKLSTVVVLEDDVVCYPNFNQRVQALIQELPDDWDVCLLGTVGCIATERELFFMKLYSLMSGGGRPSPGKTRGVSENVYVPHRPAGTHAYLISQRGASKLARLCPKARYHVDLTAWGRSELNLYAAKEQLATQRFDDDTTVSKEGAPWTKIFLRWCLDITGLSYMAKRGGAPCPAWTWTIACFAIPIYIPFSSKRRRLIVEMGPSSSIFVLICLASIPLRSLKPLGFGLLYFTSMITTIRWLAGTSNIMVTAFLAVLGGALLKFG